MENDDAYRQMAKAKLDEIDAKIVQIKATAEQADAEARIQAAREINQLDLRKKQLQIRLNELKASGEAAFDEMKTGVEKALAELKSAVDSAIAKFG
jgi:hypothetical protein